MLFYNLYLKPGGKHAKRSPNGKGGKDDDKGVRMDETVGPKGRIFLRRSATYALPMPARSAWPCHDARPARTVCPPMPKRALPLALPLALACPVRAPAFPSQVCGVDLQKGDAAGFFHGKSDSSAEQQGGKKTK
jgi:hypothetical protein